MMVSAEGNEIEFGAMSSSEVGKLPRQSALHFSVANHRPNAFPFGFRLLNNLQRIAALSAVKY